MSTMSEPSGRKYMPFALSITTGIGAGTDAGTLM